MTLFSKKGRASSAEVVDNHLILSLPNAAEPIVWRMSLDKIGNASFEIKKAKNEDAFNLVLKTKKGTAETIAPFSQKQEALDALIHASDALQKSETKNDNDFKNNNSYSDTKTETNPRIKKGNNKWLYLFLGFLAVIALYTYMINQVPNKINGLNGSSQNVSSGNQNSPQTGVPLSADDFLNGL